MLTWYLDQRGSRDVYVYENGSGIDSPEMTLTSSIHYMMQFTSFILGLKSNRKWVISAFPIQMPMEQKLTLP